MYYPFNCKNKTDEIQNTSTDSFQSELNAIFGEVLNLNNESFHMVGGGRLYQTNLIISEADILFNIARKQWKQAEESALEETIVQNINVSEVRTHIVNLLSLCRYSVQNCPNGCQKIILQKKLLRYLKILKNTIISWRNLEEKFLNKLTASSVKDCQLPIYHYFHMYLDVQWLTLGLNYICGVPPGVSDVLNDLVILSHTLYKKLNKTEVLHTSVFICPCVKRLWIYLQLFNEQLLKVSVEKKTFWDIFNDSLKSSNDVFSLWVLNDVALLQGYTEEGKYTGPSNIRVCDNHSFIELKLKSITANCTPSSDNELMLLNCCKLVDALLNQWWLKNVKSDHYQLLWNIFNRHINLICSFDKEKSAVELNKLVNQIINNPQTNNSYEYFLYMLNKYLIKFPNQWPRLRGRIYCKLSPNKINELGDNGICNITLLFLILGHSVNITEMTEKLSTLLCNLTRERQNTSLILNIHLSLVILNVHQGCSVKEVCSPILQVIQNASEDRKLFHLIRIYVSGIDGVLNASQNFNLEQHIMINGWVTKYVTSCEYNHLCYFLNILLYHIRRIRISEAWNKWEGVLKQYVLSALKMKSVSMCPNSPSQVGELAALIEPNPASDWILIFTADVIAPNVSCLFISTLLEDVAENFMMPKNHENAILHAWIRCCLLNSKDSQRLTRNVRKIRALASVFPVKSEVSDKPLTEFIINISKLSSKINLQELCEQCFGRLDSWVVAYLKDPFTEVQVAHMYACMADLFFHCASLLYHKNRTNCLLNKLINIFLLPSHVLIGNSPHKYVLNAIERTWHRFVEGIFALDCSNDAYLERTLRDMVVRYFLLLPPSGSPMLKCLGNKKLAALILERIAVAYLSRSNRSSDGHTIKALKFVQLAFEYATSTEIRRIILQSTLGAILEVIMFNNERNDAIDIVVSFSKCEELKEYFKLAIFRVTEKHLAFNANNYFQCTNILAKVIPVDMRSVLSTIKKKLVEVERMRGVSYDNTLRQSFDRLEMLLA